MVAPAPFEFFDPGPLRDGPLSLRCVAHHPADPARGWVPSYDFDPHVDGTVAPIGRINFRAGYTPNMELYGGHFAYRIDLAHQGHHYAERSVRLLFPLARRHGLSTVWITCLPTNPASRRTCERLGGEMVGIIDLPPDLDLYQAGWRQVCRYRVRLP